jgi:hypothetical protein
MSKPKFKVGDKVKVKTNRDVRDLTRRGFPEGIIKQIGEVVDLTPFDDLVIVRFQNSFAKWRVPTCFLKLAKPEKIIIYRNGAEVVAKNTATGKTGVARCNPADEFDFNTGAKLAFERLINPEPEKPKKPKYYNGKVVCVSPFTSFYTKGKVYEIKDGVGKDDVGNIATCIPVKSFEEFNQQMLSKFIELVE